MTYSQTDRQTYRQTDRQTVKTDHGGPRQSPKTSRDTPQIAAFSFVHSLTGVKLGR